MKLFKQLLVALAASQATAFTPAASATRSAHTVASMGLFDGIAEYFSEEAKAKREEEKQRMIEEQEAAYREVLERRRNPEMMEEYMEKRKERLSNYMGGDSTSNTEEE